MKEVIEADQVIIRSADGTDGPFQVPALKIFDAPGALASARKSPRAIGPNTKTPKPSTPFI